MLKIIKTLWPGFILFIVLLVLAGCGGKADSPAPVDTSSNTPASSTSSANAGVQTSPAARSSAPSATTALPKSYTVQEIAANSIAANEKIKTLKFDMDFAMVFGLGMGEDAESMNMKQIATAAVNIPDRKMAMTMEMSLEMPDQGQQNMSAEIYAIDGWMYMRASAPNAGDQWSKMKLTEEAWAQQSRLSSMTDFLKSPVKLELTGSENIRGIDCYVLNLTPNEESLADWMDAQTQDGQAGQIMNNLGMSQLFDKFMVKEWIAKDSFFLVRQQIAMKFKDDTAETGATPSIFDRMSMDIDATIDYYDHNRAVNVQLPPEALAARELTQ